MFTNTVDFGSLLTLCLVVGMALSLGDINAVFRRARAESRSSGVANAIRGLSAHMQILGNPDLQFVAFDTSGAVDIVIANVGCKLYALFLKKPTASTTDAWFKGSNHATVAAANGDIVVYLRGTSGGGRSYCPTFHDGLPLGTGLTVASHTTVNGSTDSATADSPTGFAIIGAL